MSGINPINPTLGFPCPLTLKCSVTGDEVVYSDPEYIRGRIEKAGSLEILLKTYVSKAGKRQQREDAPPAPRVSGRMWKGELVQKPETVAVEASKPGANLPADIIHREFLLDDGKCTVYSPRMNADEQKHIVYDHRKKTKS